MKDQDRNRLWELLELLDDELSKRCPDWKRVRAAAKELAERVSHAP